MARKFFAIMRSLNSHLTMRRHTKHGSESSQAIENLDQDLMEFVQQKYGPYPDSFIVMDIWEKMRKTNIQVLFFLFNNIVIIIM